MQKIQNMTQPARHSQIFQAALLINSNPLALIECLISPCFHLNWDSTLNLT